VGTRTSSLRGAVTIATVVLGLLAVLVAAVLFFFTALLRRSDRTVNAAIESVHLVDDAQYELLQASRAVEPELRAGYVRALRDELARADRFVTTAHERRLLETAEEDVEHYLGAPVTAGRGELEERLERASRSLALLANLNLDQARRTEEEVAAWNDRAAVLAAVVVLLVILTVMAIVRWLRWQAFDPITGLAGIMDRFGQGDLDARAEVRGAAELAAMARQFNGMADRLAGQRERQVTFLAGVAHDLRSPLAALRLRLDSLLGSTSEARAVRSLESALTQLDRLTRMVDDVLDAARIDAGHLELLPEVCDLRPVVRAVVDQFDSASPIHRLELRVPDQPCRVSCDAMRIEQCVTNLVSNAIKYSPDGGRVTVEVTTTGGDVAVSVRDEGIGIDDASMGRVFEPFARGARRGDAPGVGLGLSIVKRIIEAHRGTVAIVSAPGRGTSVTLRIPMLAPPVVAPSEELRALPAPGR
jgi:signal transduction histidine kinase